MKPIATFCTIFILLNSSLVKSQTQAYKDWVLKERLPIWSVEQFKNKKLHVKYLISDFINPFYLEADFNNDGILDIALAIEQQQTHKKGIIIFHGSKNDYYIFGAGTSFEKGGDNFAWMDIWKVCREPKVFDLIAEKTLQLTNPGISVIKSESAGGVIYWDGKRYKWVQISD